MATEKITAETRTEFGKGAARRIRRADKVPAVVYGHGNEPTHITLPGHETMLALKHGGTNALLEISLDGTTHLALTKQVQVDPIKRHIEHVDFVSVKRGEKVHVDVTVHLEGDAAPDTIVVLDSPTISIEAEATHIPEHVVVSIEGAEVGTQIHASDLELPAGSTLLTDPETLIVIVSQQRSEAEAEADLEEAEAELGIEHDEPETGSDAAEGAEAPAGDADSAGSDGE